MVVDIWNREWGVFGEPGTEQRGLGEWEPAVLICDFSRVRLPLVGFHFLWPPSMPVSTIGVAASSSEWRCLFPCIFCLSVTLALLFITCLADLLTVALSVTCWYLNLPQPDFLLHVGSVQRGSACLCSLALVSFGFYHFLPSLVPTCTLRFYLFGLQTTAFSKYMIHVFFWISNTWWLCSITWSMNKVPYRSC